MPMSDLSRAPAGGAMPSTAAELQHPSTFAPATLIFLIILCIFGAVIGVQLILQLGITPNTSIIGALVAMLLARVPGAIFARYRSIHVQNLAQSAISAATFGAANSLLLPIGVPFLLGRADLIVPMLVGAALSMLLDGYLLYRMFDTRVFPASGTWPPGIAAAEAIRAGDAGGRRAALLGVGLLIGIAGSWLKIPMSAFGVAFVVYAAFAAFVHELIVGISAMHAGWFPAFAVALITLIIGILLGFPPVALALLVGFSASTGPAFADMGYDLRAGYLLRGQGANPSFELAGRKQQLYAAMLAFLIAIPTVYFAHPGYFAQDMVPPVDRVYIATIKAGATADVAMALLIWAIPGAIIQWLGGPARQLGILLATGLLIPNPLAGWAVLVGIAIRIAVLRFRGKEASGSMEVLAAGFIGGDALYGFFDSVIKTVPKVK